MNDSSKLAAIAERAKEVTAQLERSTAALAEHREKTAVIVERNETLEKVAKDQGALIEAQTRVMAMVKEGDIDASQIDETLNHILKHGLALYNDVLAAEPRQSIGFGGLVDPKLEKISGGLEKTGEVPTYYGVDVPNPVEQVLIGIRDQMRGGPGLQW